eukprot:2364005-Pleurochrysis_carterae.AAC.1
MAIAVHRTGVSYNVVPPVTIGLNNLDIENALGDGPVAIRHFSTLDVKIVSKSIVLWQDSSLKGIIAAFVIQTTG